MQNINIYTKKTIWNHVRYISTNSKYVCIYVCVLAQNILCKPQICTTQTCKKIMNTPMFKSVLSELLYS